jgi:hypothetical protein
MKRPIFFFTVSIAALISGLDAHSSGPWTAARPDGHAPIGVMGDHRHKSGDWMFSYRYMQMAMDGNRDGTDRVSEADVLADFMVAPRTMTMDMHMLGGMYAISDKVTIMAMLPWTSKEMDHITRMGGMFTTRTNGIGDASLSTLFGLHSSGGSELLGELGLGLPTGSVTERGATPMGPDQKLPYPMQLGSGSWEFRPRITYVDQHESWSFGAQAGARIRLDENSQDYKLGNEYSATAWSAARLNRRASVSIRALATTWGDISGADPELNPMMVPTARTDLRAGTRIDLLIGLNLYGADGTLKGHRLALELGVPVYQNLDGPQLETDWTGTFGYQYSF